MRVLLALDGSPSSDTACELVGSLTWPEGSVIDMIGVVEPPVEVVAPFFVPEDEPAAIDQGATERLREVLDRAVSRLERPTLIVRRTVLVGRPGTVIVQAAGDLRAELVVLGSRRLGPVRSMLLGSVSAEIVDHAPCPVLVARRPVIDAILVAVDGSPSARAVVTYLAANRVFGRRPVEVMSVAPTGDVIGAYPLAGISDSAFEAVEAEHTELRHRAEAVATVAAQELRQHGYDARPSIGIGNAAREIIESAVSFGAGLIVMGSRGRTGMKRLVLGSVARNVLLHTSASVLIVHEPLRIQSTQPGMELDVILARIGAA